MAGTCPDCNEHYEGTLGGHWQLSCRQHKHKIKNLGTGRGVCICGATFIRAKKGGE